MKTTKILSILLITSFLPGCAAVVLSTAATGVMVAHDRRTTGTIVEDKSIQLKATQAIQDVVQKNQQVHVSAHSYNNRVLLVGQAPTRRMKAQIEESVRGVEKIKHLHNEIVVSASTPLKTRSVDGLITTRIKGEMAVTKEFNPTRVKVITENGVVYLMGIVKRDEEEIAVDIARNVRGVTRVVKIFEYDPK